MEEHADQSSDQEIVKRVVAGEVNAFACLLSRHQNFVLRLLRRHIPSGELDEVAHEVFIRAYCMLGSFAGKSSFRQWLSGIAVRTSYDFWRKQYRSREVPLSSLPEHCQQLLHNITTEENVSLSEQMETLRELLMLTLAQFSPEDRMVFELVYLQQLSGKEAAKLLGWNIANVKIRTFRLRQKLCKLLSKQI